MSGNAATPAPDATSDGFGSTAWSLVLAAGQDIDGGQALDRLCRKHWRPIYIFARRSGVAPTDAEDVTQAFFAYLLEKGWIRRADPGRGSFRAYLLALLRNFLANHRRQERAEKRGGGLASLSIDGAEAEKELAAVSETGSDPARAYEAAWARDILQAAWARLAHEQASAGKSEQFQILRPYVSEAPGAGDYERVAKQLALRPGQVALAVHRISRRFAELIRAEVAETLADRSELEAELRHLLAVSGA